MHPTFILIGLQLQSKHFPIEPKKPELTKNGDTIHKVLKRRLPITNFATK